VGCTVGRESIAWKGLLRHAPFSCRACVTDGWRQDLKQHGCSHARKKLLHEYFTAGKGRGKFVACIKAIARKKGRERKNNKNYFWAFFCMA